MIGLANDTTKFAYGPLTVGNSAANRPVLVTDPNGLSQSMQYDATTWNSAVSTRAADNASARAFYNTYGRPDSILDPINVRTFFRYDQLGRIRGIKTGFGPTAPTTRTYYAPGGLVDSVRVFGAGDAFVEGMDTLPIGSVQTTKTFYNRLGLVDSTITPGGRRMTVGAQRDNYGNPVFEFTGNGTSVERLRDWAGRVYYQAFTQVDPVTLGQEFASPPADSIYRSLGLEVGKTLSAGQQDTLAYDSKGRLVLQLRREGPYFTDSTVAHKLGYSRVGALTADTITLRGGARVIRSFEYNRRGQRTLARDTIVLLGSGTLLGERGGTVRYYYNPATARMDSMVGMASTLKVARIRWFFDRGGRDSIRIVRLGSGAGYAADSIRTRFIFDAAGRISLIVDSSATTGIWHRFDSPLYDAADHLKGAQGRRPNELGTVGTDTFGYGYDSTNGTWRLRSTTKQWANLIWTNSYTYDTVGNRLTDDHGYNGQGICSGTEASTYGPDNTLGRTMKFLGTCHNIASRFWQDRAGNRLVQLDTNTTSGTYLGPQTVLTYTANNELAFSMTWTIQVGTYDYNWHWYDDAGRRVITQRTTGQYWIPPTGPVGPSTYYVYDGSDVALTLLHNGTNWSTRGRYLTGGIDQPLAGRFDGATNLALIGDRQGTTLVALRGDGTKEINAIYYPRDAYGGLPGVNGQAPEGSTNTETGYAGASTPNGTGGFAYLRNRWYDPKTGRFLTQDPIGLAGGVNLYSYAANDPVASTDPFGLCSEGTDFVYSICSGEIVSQTPNNLDHDRIFLVDDRGTVVESRATLEAIEVVAEGPPSTSLDAFALVWYNVVTPNGGLTYESGGYHTAEGKSGSYETYGFAVGWGSAVGQFGHTRSTTTAFPGGSAGYCGGALVVTVCRTSNEGGHSWSTYWGPIGTLVSGYRVWSTTTVHE